MNFRQTTSRLLTNLHGFRTKRRIVVIESDDWGSIRMPSREVYEKCLKEGYPVNLNPFERYDSLASEDDLNQLFDLLTSFSDKNGKNPVITANCVVANPDFEKIKNNDFKNYYYESINQTFNSYPNHKCNLEIWQKGKSDGLFFPQYHAREHLNVSKFINALQNNDSDAMFGLQHKMPGSIRKSIEGNGNYFVEATHFDSETDKTDKMNIYLEGLDLFNDLFGYSSESIVPPNYIWSNDFNSGVAKKGVKYIQGIRKMKEPKEGSFVYKNRFMGQMTESGQLNLVRNCLFEPTITSFKNPVEYCLRDMEIAFKMNKPAIICSHRVNYVGSIDIGNRDNTLKLLQLIIKQALKKWPDLEFLTSVELGLIISQTNKF